MFKLSIGDTIYLANEALDSSVIGKVSRYTVGNDVNGQESILTITVKGIDTFKIAQASTWQSLDELWQVDEVNGSAPQYVMPELEAIGELLEQFPTIHKG